VCRMRLIRIPDAGVISKGYLVTYVEGQNAVRGCVVLLLCILFSSLASYLLNSLLIQAGA
jgi:hypothetical protein